MVTHWSSLLQAKSSMAVPLNDRHRLLSQAGFTYYLPDGRVVFLPPGRRVLLKIARIIRGELVRAGGQEMRLATDISEAANRETKETEGPIWEQIPHFAEVATLISKDLHSYKECPQLWFEIESESHALKHTLNTNVFLVDCEWTRVNLGYSNLARMLDSILERCGVKCRAVTLKLQEHLASVSFFSASSQTELHNELVASLVAPIPDLLAKWNASVNGEHGDQIPLFISSCSISTEQLLAASVEQNRDEAGLLLPPLISPFHVLVSPHNQSDKQQVDAAKNIAVKYAEAGLDSLLDDQVHSLNTPTVDPLMTGVPYQVIVGKDLSVNSIMLKDRYRSLTESMTIDDSLIFLATNCLRVEQN
jgi:hypothetical protein